MVQISCGEHQDSCLGLAVKPNEERRSQVEEMWTEFVDSTHGQYGLAQVKEGIGDVGQSMMRAAFRILAAGEEMPE